MPLRCLDKTYLTLELEPSELGKAEPAFVIDDVELVCGHHYHWNCIMDYAMATQNGAKDLKCTQCQAGVLHPVDHKFLVTVRNEGG